MFLNLTNDKLGYNSTHLFCRSSEENACWKLALRLYVTDKCLCLYRAMFSDGVRQTFVNDGLICLCPCNYAHMCV